MNNLELELRYLQEHLERLRKENNSLHNIVLTFIRDHIFKNVTESDDKLRKFIDYSFNFNGKTYVQRKITDIQSYSESVEKYLDEDMCREIKYLFLKECGES